VKIIVQYFTRTFSAGFHAAGDVDCVTKETVSRHCNSDHSADHRAAVKAAAYHQLAIWTVSNLQSSTNWHQNIMLC